MSSTEAGIGHNNPPSFLEQLRAKHATFRAEFAELEARARRLPKELGSEEDVGEVIVYVRDCKSLISRAESARVAEKAEPLEQCNVIDDYFGTIKRTVKQRADGIELRATAFLRAKREREEAERRAREAEARQRAEEERQRAEALRREAEKKRLEVEAAQRAQDEAAKTNDQAAFEEAQRDERQAVAGVGIAEDRAGFALQSAAKAEREADREERSAGKPLERVVVAGASAKLKPVWRVRIVDRAALHASLGPLVTFFLPGEIDDALARAAKTRVQPVIPGVEFYEEEVAKVR